MRLITTRNATFQQWQALLTSRAKRHRARQFVVQGVRPIALAMERGWTFHALLHPHGQPLSDWARQALAKAPGVAMAPELLAELGEKGDDAPELVAVLAIPSDDPLRIPVRDDGLVVVFDRPTSPGNVGTLIRSADALGADGVIVTGHAADPYDSKAVRASTGSLFTVPVVRMPSHREVVGWARPAGFQIVGTDEAGDLDIDAYDLTGPRVVVIGNETRGLSNGWREACDRMLRIPMSGGASSLNAAAAATVVLYEAARQRRA